MGYNRQTEPEVWDADYESPISDGEDYDEELVHPEIRKIDLYGEE